MPIRESERARYPSDWKRISKRIRKRAGNRCEGSPGHYPDCRAENCADENLRAMCQRCHLTYDAAHHAENARQTRRAKMAAGDLFDALPEVADAMERMER